jgi:hypothetical protein
MNDALNRARRRARGVWWLAAALAATAAACGKDDAESPPATVAGSAGSAGSAPDASAPAGGSGGQAALPAAGTGGEAARSDAGAPPSEGGSCAPGETRECLFDRLCSGVQTCSADGAFGACDCGAATLVGSGSVGGRCGRDADCAEGGVCLLADSDLYLGQGGPAGGYCTFSCTGSGDTDDCPAHDPQSFCAPLGPDGSTYCIRTCLSQEPAPGEAKCLNRPDLVCRSVVVDGVEPFNGMRQAGYCKPQCGSDEDCPAGRVCHKQGGICTLTQIGGAPIGAACSLDSDCSGFACENRDDDGVGICTAECVLGSLSGCGYGRVPESRNAGCITPLVAAGRFAEGPGDTGLCRELCDVAEDCVRASEGWTCTPINAAAAEFFGRSGACVPP